MFLSGIFKANNKNQHVYEWCSLCETEVKLKAVLKTQTCPNCKKSIKPCSMCLMDNLKCVECKLDA